MNFIPHQGRSDGRTAGVASAENLIFSFRERPAIHKVNCVASRLGLFCRFIDGHDVRFLSRTGNNSQLRNSFQFLSDVSGFPHLLLRTGRRWTHSAPPWLVFFLYVFFVVLPGDVSSHCHGFYVCQVSLVGTVPDTVSTMIGTPLKKFYRAITSKSPVLTTQLVAEFPGVVFYSVLVASVAGHRVYSMSKPPITAHVRQQRLRTFERRWTIQQKKRIDRFVFTS